MLAATTWQDVAVEFVKQLAAIIVALGGLVWAFRRYVKPKIDKIDSLDAKQDTALANQARIEKKADGQHEKQLEAVKKAGKYEGAQEAKQEVNFTTEQIARAVEQVLTAQAKLRGRRRNDG